MASWEDQANSVAANLTNLNVNASVFVPGQNINAPAFVPVFGAPAAASEHLVEAPAQVALTSPPPAEEIPAPEPVNVDVESWEDEEPEDTEEEEEEGVKDAPVAPKKVNVDVRKEHLSLVFVGHVDAGKSTIGGHLLYLTGMVEQRTLEKYEREAKEKNRETWYLSWALDTNAEERDKGKTVEVGRAFFETKKKHFSVLDAPGHKSFVPNMISGSSQADLAVLVISARRGEFETGFEKGGQTREHAMLVKTAGVRHLIVLINKMDDPTVNWDQKRYEECKNKLTPYLKKTCGFPSDQIFFMPCSGLTGMGLKLQVPENLCPWYRGPAFLDYLDDLPSLSRLSEGPLRLPIADKYRDMGTVILGKIESGRLCKGQNVVMMPNRISTQIMEVWWDDLDVDKAESGDSVKLKIRGVEETDVTAGFMLCQPDNLCHTTDMFDAQIIIMEHDSIICAGYSAVLHLHTIIEEVSIRLIICTIDRKTNKKDQIRPMYIKQDQVAIARFHVKGGTICIERYSDFPQMGRFTLRDEGRTVAIGKVLKILPSTSSMIQQPTD